MGISLSAFASSAPDWLTGTSKKYLENEYIIGVGLADSLDSARSSARAEIAKIFQSRITQSSESISTEKSTIKNNTANSVSEIKAESKINVSTDQVLEGVKIAETYYDKSKKTYYALAILNKARTRALLSSQIAEQEGILTSMVSSVDRAKSPVERLQLLSGALTAYDKRELLAAKRMSVDPMNIPELKGVQRNDLQVQFNNALSQIVFAVDTGDDLGLKAAVSERITGLGFKIAPSASENIAPDAEALYVKCDLTVEPFERSNPQWKFYNWSGNVRITEGSSKNKILTVATKSGQVSQLSEDASKDKALIMGSQAVASMVEESIKQYILVK